MVRTLDQFVGIDVAKAELVVAERPSATPWTVPNDEAGVRTLTQRLRAAAPTLIVLEATGEYRCSPPSLARSVQRGSPSWW